MTEISFLADSMLGKLAKWLRILGYDTAYCRVPLRDAEQLRKARAEGRRVLTRSTRLARCAGPKPEICIIKANDPLQQVREVLSHYHLVIAPRAPMTRCLICNRELIPIAPALLASRIPEYVLATRQLFLTCSGCHRVFWRGTHCRNMEERIKQHFAEP